MSTPHAERGQNLFVDRTNATCKLEINKAALRIAERLVGYFCTVDGLGQEIPVEILFGLGPGVIGQADAHVGDHSGKHLIEVR